MSNLFDEAADILQRDGWIQGMSHNENGRCMVSALVQAAETTNQEPVGFAIAFAESQPELGLRRYGIPNWNDAYGRTIDEVLHALKLLSEAYELKKEKGLL